MQSVMIDAQADLVYAGHTSRVIGFVGHWLKYTERQK